MSFFEFTDIKYVRVDDIAVILPSKSGTTQKIIYIPPLDVFKEAFILNKAQEINNQSIDLNEIQIAKNVAIIIRTAIGPQADSIDNVKDTLHLYNAIINSITESLSAFNKDTNLQKYLTIKSTITTDKNKTKNEPFPYKPNFLNIIYYVLSRISIPDLYTKYCGIRFFLIAYRYLVEQEETQKISWIPLLQETGLTANCYVKMDKRVSQFEKILSSFRSKYGYDNDIGDIADSQISMEELIEIRRQAYWDSVKNNSNNHNN